MSFQPGVEKLVLGTVQLGLTYGISNTRGKPSESEAFDILGTAKRLGILTWDTARGYGESEEIIGRFLGQDPGTPPRIVTKLQPFPEALKSPAAFVREQVEQARSRLNVRTLDTLLFHREEDLAGPHGPEAWSALEELRVAGVVTRLGTSSYSPDLLQKLLEQFSLQVAQVPFHILDDRFFRGPLPALYEGRRTEIHVRSVFLQGLYFLTRETCPEKMRFALPVLEKLGATAARAGLTLPQLSLALALDHPHIAKAVIGVTSARELEEIVTWPKPSLQSSALMELERIRADAPARMLDPRLW